MNSLIPAHHLQWFEVLKEAALNGDLALISCIDAATGEDRSVICAVNRMDEGAVEFVPLGHLAVGENPYDYYLPPIPGGTVQ